MKKVFILIALALMAVTASSVASAQSTSRAPELYNEAIRIYERAKSEADFLRAAAKYEEALNLYQRERSDQGIAHVFHGLGRVNASLSKYDEALSYYERSLAIYRKLGDKREQGNNLNEIGNVYSWRGDFAKALEFWQEFLRISQQLGDVLGEGNALLNIGGAYNYLGQRSEALECLEKSLAIARRLRNASLEGLAFNNIGNVYDNLGDYKKSLESQEKALAIFQKLGDLRNQKEALTGIGKVSGQLGQYTRALGAYGKVLEITRKLGDVQGEGLVLSHIGMVYDAFGNKQKALEQYEKSLLIGQKLGDDGTQADALNNLGVVLLSLGLYGKALEHFERALKIDERLGKVEGQHANISNMGLVYESWGQYRKALEYYGKSLAVAQKVGDIRGEAIGLAAMGRVDAANGNFSAARQHYEESLELAKKLGTEPLEAQLLVNLGEVQEQLGEFESAMAKFKEGFEFCKKMKVPTDLYVDRMGNLYLEMGNVEAAEKLIGDGGFLVSRGRVQLAKSNYKKAIEYYEAAARLEEESGSSDGLFAAYTGLGRAYEGLEDYKRAAEAYQKALDLTEEIRASLLPHQRKNFFSVRIFGFYRSEPSKGLTRVRIKLNEGDVGLEASEYTRARSLSDNIALRSEAGISGVPREILEKEDELIFKLAAVKKDLSQTDKNQQQERYENLRKEALKAEASMKSFVEMLRQKYKPYAAVKYPRPVSIKDSALRSDEIVLFFDVFDDAIAIRLLKGKEILQTHLKAWKRSDLEESVRRFRKSFEGRNRKSFDPELAGQLYTDLVASVLANVPRGTPITIIPDGLLSLIPFEALVADGRASWAKNEFGDYPEGITYLGDLYPISYHHSITAITLARTLGEKKKTVDTMLVIADPVFRLKDERAQASSQTKIAGQSGEHFLNLMATVEDSSQGKFTFPRLPESSRLAQDLKTLYGGGCESCTALQANKEYLMKTLAPKLDQYGSVVFATHGVFSTRIPGIQEPFLALTMVPPGTDGFLKMSDVMGLKMNADTVALTACETGLGKDVSGEGVMSMGRAFQYAGAKSVLMSLWSVADKSSVQLTENFFRNRKTGKTKLESLKLAREEIRKAGFEHPFFWAAFILVGETD